MKIFQGNNFVWTWEFFECFMNYFWIFLPRIKAMIKLISSSSVKQFLLNDDDVKNHCMSSFYDIFFISVIFFRTQAIFFIDKHPIAMDVGFFIEARKSCGKSFFVYFSISLSVISILPQAYSRCLSNRFCCVYLIFFHFCKLMQKKLNILFFLSSLKLLNEMYQPHVLFAELLQLCGDSHFPESSTLQFIFIKMQTKQKLFKIKAELLWILSEFLWIFEYLKFIVYQPCSRFLKVFSLNLLEWFFLHFWWRKLLLVFLLSRNEWICNTCR